MITQGAKKPWWKRWWVMMLLVIGSLFIVWIIYFAFTFAHYYQLAKLGKLLPGGEVPGKFTTSEKLRAAFSSGVQVTDTTTILDATANDDPTLGKKGAPIEIVEFADFGCPFSRDESFVVRELLTAYPDRIHFTYRDFPIDELHPQARLAAEAGGCANEQGSFWAFHDKVYQNQNQLGIDNLTQYAISVGMDGDKFRQCVVSGRYRDEVAADESAGVAAGVVGTPTFFINGVRIAGAIPRDLFEEIVQSLVKK